MPSPEDLTPISTWLEAIHQAIKDHAESVTKYQQSEQSDRQQQAQAGINTVVRLPVEVTEYYRAEQRERPVKKRFERIRICLEIVGVIAAVILAIITFKTLLVFNRRFSEMHTQTATLQQQAAQSALDSQQQLELSRKQIIVAQRSVNAIGRQMQQDQRAWVNISFGNLTVAEGQVTSVPVAITNTGKTPARKFTLELVVQQVENKRNSLRFSYNVPHLTDTAGFILPNAPPILLIGQDKVLSHTNAIRLQEGTDFIVMFARITYFDVFGTNHWTKACKFLDPSNKGAFARQCTDYNDIDNN